MWLSCLLAVVAGAFVWTRQLNGMPLVGFDITYVTDDVRGATHPVAYEYVRHFAGLVECVFLVGLTVGARGPRVRLVAGGVLLLVCAVLVTTGVRTLGDASSHVDLSRAAADRFAAAVVFTLALSALGGAVALVCRRFVFHDGFVAGLLAGAGSLHLVAVFLLASALDPPMELTGWAWVPGVCHLVAAGCVAAWVAGRRETAPLPG
ncbi:hypothetical protein [Streptomyces sp. UH6]|uniref:hypothetical protein n=1 Tax=Streptomyces sp. UH6 TaxID=2748379 RepID=UPI0015D4BDA0|nr:hypothetical protein [Streptomyces sp. UH6]NYV75931.1 hypothetical protein [Streptomyces sp. UH6]